MEKQIEAMWGTISALKQQKKEKPPKKAACQQPTPSASSSNKPAKAAACSSKKTTTTKKSDKKNAAIPGDDDVLTFEQKELSEAIQTLDGQKRDPPPNLPPHLLVIHRHSLVFAFPTPSYVGLSEVEVCRY